MNRDKLHEILHTPRSAVPQGSRDIFHEIETHLQLSLV